MIEPFLKLPIGILRSDLGAPAKILIAYLIARQGSNPDAWPSTRKMAEDCGMSLGAILRAIGELESSKLVEVIRPIGNPRHQVNRYRVNATEVGTFSKWERSQDGSDKRYRNGYVPETGTYPFRSADRSQNGSDIATESVADLDLDPVNRSNPGVIQNRNVPGSVAFPPPKPGGGRSSLQLFQPEVSAIFEKRRRPRPSWGRLLSIKAADLLEQHGRTECLRRVAAYLDLSDPDLAKLLGRPKPPPVREVGLCFDRFDLWAVQPEAEGVDQQLADDLDAAILADNGGRR